MKEDGKYCKLCNVEKSSKIASHFVSKFLGKDLLYEGKSLQIDKDFKIQFKQDLPKKRFVFCSNCEKKFEILETYIARKLSNIDKQDNFGNFFYIIDDILQKRLIVNEYPKVYNLFVLSLIWRVSISNDYAYLKYKLPEQTEEKIREILNKHLKSNQNELLFNKELFELKFSYCIIKPEFRNEHTRGVLTTYSASLDIHFLFSVNFAIFTYTDPNCIPIEIRAYCNNESDKFTIVLSNSEKWSMLNETVVNKMITKKQRGRK